MFTFRSSQAELDSLTNLIGSMWTQYKPHASPTNLDLDDMFSFLVQEENNLNSAKSSNQVLDDIYKQFEDLGDKLEEDMVIINKYSRVLKSRYNVQVLKFFDKLRYRMVCAT